MSALISTYAGERADRLNAALLSIATQTLPPRQLVIVCDGPIGPDQERTIEEVAARHGEIDWRVVRLSTNVGLGPALNAGLAECREPYVARMDSDDVSVPDRLAAQWTFLRSHPEVDLLAGWQAEFYDDPERVLRIKTTPEGHDAIVRSLIWRCVISHPTIMFRREAVSKLGGYRPIRFLEDYDLYMRLIAGGGHIHALQRPLVKVRTSPSQYRRRGGVAHLKSELRFRRDCYQRGNLTFIEFAASLGAYSVFRMMPASLRLASYRLVRVGSDKTVR
ncbi:MAG: glycosyltransferase [Candidatus Limnocylindrales bacterium]